MTSTPDCVSFRIFSRLELGSEVFTSTAGMDLDSLAALLPEEAFRSAETLSTHLDALAARERDLP